MPEDKTYGRSEAETKGTGSGSIPQDKSDAQVADALARQALSTTAGSGLGLKGKAIGVNPPKQNTGESPADFGARMRAYREAQTQRKALSK